MNDIIEFLAIVLPERKKIRKTCILEVWDNTKEGDLFNCIDPKFPEKVFKVIKILGNKVYYYSD